MKIGDFLGLLWLLLFVLAVVALVVLAGYYLVSDRQLFISVAVFVGLVALVVWSRRDRHGYLSTLGERGRVINYGVLIDAHEVMLTGRLRSWGTGSVRLWVHASASELDNLIEGLEAARESLSRRSGGAK